MNPIVAQFVREAVLVLASGAVVGGALYGQGQPLRVAITAGIVAAATQVLKDWVPQGVAVSVAQAKAGAAEATPKS